MRTVIGNGTISEDCGFELEYLAGTPTTAVSTGDRWYTGEENGEPRLVHHTEGTPANASTTRIFTPLEVKEKFAWDWNHVPSFAPVKDWVEANLCKLCVCDFPNGSATIAQRAVMTGHYNEAGGFCCSHHGNTCGHCHQYDH